MRSIIAWPAVIVGTLLAAQASAQITSWSDRGTGPRAREVHFIAFSALALPEGGFGSASTSQARFAKPGAAIGLGFSARYSNEVEAGAVLLVAMNPADRGAVGASVVAQLQSEGVSSDPRIASVTGLQTTWGLVSVGLAPKVDEHLRASLDVYGGALYAHEPAVKMVAPPPQLALIQLYKSWLGLAAGAGASVLWREHLAIGLLFLTGASNSTWRSPLPGSLVGQPYSILLATVGYSFGH